MNDANQTQLQVAALSDALHKEVARVKRWVIACLVFALAVSALVAATKSLVFLIVAAFAWFFAWNRWKVQRYLSACLPMPPENQDAWLDKTKLALSIVPTWYRLSETFAAGTFLVGFALITIVVVPTSGNWMRLLYGAAWSVIVVRIVREAVHRQKQKQSNSPAR